MNEKKEILNFILNASEAEQEKLALFIVGMNAQKQIQHSKTQYGLLSESNLAQKTSQKPAV